ncbi:MAG TPA: universal stress protein [Burkholderiaceae bacterium]|nr:universal stress protein [Burkholderiaceae bacterium]
MKILLPVDGSRYTKQMLGYVAAHEELFGSQHEYIFATVVATVPPHVTHFVGRTALQGYYKEEADKVLAPVLAFAAQHGWNARSLQLEGPAAEVLAKAAKSEKVDLVVMGSHGQSALSNVLLGSVASGVLARCDVPVLLIR